MAVAELVRRHEAAWLRATRHPFLAGVRAGTLPESSFDVWLVQDHHFVGDLLRFQARLLAAAPPRARRVLAAGLVALVDELGWFERLAAERALDVDAPRLPATEAYGQLLARLEQAGFAAAITGLWALERAYLDAWSFAAPAAAPYEELVAHWTTPAFAAYVEALESAADEADGTGSVEEAFVAVVDAEAAFWEPASP